MPVIKGFAPLDEPRSSGRLEGFTPAPSYEIPEQPKRTVLGTLGDVGVTAIKSAVGLPQAFVGLADIPTGGKIGKALEELGYRPDEAQKILDTWYSAAQQRANQEVENADGFVPTLAAMAANPSTIAHKGLESLSSMAGGAGLARGAMRVLPGLGPKVASAVGEGLIGAGSAAETVRNQTEDRELSAKQAALSALSGFGTGVLGLAGNRVAGKLGLGDVDEALVRGTVKSAAQVGDKARPGLLRNFLGAGVAEGFIEEMPQSVQEQVMQNLATGRPWDERVGKAAAEGALTGFAVGGGYGALSRRTTPVDLTGRGNRSPEIDRAISPDNPDPAGISRTATPLQQQIDSLVGVGVPPADTDRAQREQELADVFGQLKTTRTNGDYAGLSVVHPATGETIFPDDPRYVETVELRGYSAGPAAMAEAAAIKAGKPAQVVIPGQPGATSTDTTGAPPASADSSAPKPSKIFSAEQQWLMDRGIAHHGKKMLAWVPELQSSGLSDEELSPVYTLLSDTKYSKASKVFAQLLVDRKRAQASGGGTNGTAGAANSVVAGGSGLGGGSAAGGLGDSGSTVGLAGNAGGNAGGTSAVGGTNSSVAGSVGQSSPAVTVTPEKTQTAPSMVRSKMTPEQIAQAQADWADMAPEGSPDLFDLPTAYSDAWLLAGGTTARGKLPPRSMDFASSIVQANQEDTEAESQGPSEVDGGLLGTFRQIFGDRDAQILYDRYVGGMSHEEIANKHGLSRQAVTKYAGDSDAAAKLRSARVQKFATEQGWTPEYTNEFLRNFLPATSEDVVTDTANDQGERSLESDSVVQGTAKSAVEDQAAGLEAAGDDAPTGVDADVDPTLTQAGFGITTAGGSQSNWRDTSTNSGQSADTAAALRAVQQKLAENRKKQEELDERIAQAAGDKAQLRDLGVEAADLEAERERLESDEATLETERGSAARQTSASLTQRAIDLDEQRRANVERLLQARALGKREVSLGGALRGVRELLALNRDLKRQIREAMTKSAAALRTVAKPTGTGAAPTAASAAAPGEKEAQDRWIASGRDLKQSSDEDLALLLGKARRLQNASLASQIGAEIEARGGKPAPTDSTENAPTAPVKPSAKTPPQDSGQSAWEKLRVAQPDLRGYDELSDLERGALTEVADRLGPKATLKQLADEPVVQELVRPTTEGTQFGRSKPEKQSENTYTAAELLEELLAFMRVRSLGPNVTVVNDVTDLKDFKDLVIGTGNRSAFGWTRDGRAVLIANRIAKGQGRAKFMHEVGAHLGIEGLLSDGDQAILVAAVLKWASRNGTALETKIAKRAMARVRNAQKEAEAAGTPLSQSDVDAETIAYFLEEAVLAGVDPTAGHKLRGPMADWFRTLWAAFKSAVRKVVNINPDKLTAQDLVNLAYGAARLEVAGSWHGTAADFRRFSNEFMSTGEGAQAYGWGTYLAQGQGVAREYWQADVSRKGFERTLSTLKDKYVGWSIATDVVHPLTQETLYPAGTKIVDRLRVELPDGTRVRMYDAVETLSKLGIDELRLKSPAPGRTRGREQTVSLSAPAGNLMRVDVGVEDGDLLDWDAPLSEQPKALAFMRARGISDPRLKTGQDLYKLLIARAWAASGNTGGWSSASNATRLEVKKAASLELLDGGIEGLRYLDENNRLGDRNDPRATRNLVIFDDKKIVRVASQRGASRNGVRFGLNERVEDLPEPLREPVRTITDALQGKGGRLLNTVMFTEDVINRAVNLGVRAANTLRTIYQQRAAMAGRVERQVENVLSLYNDVPASEQGTGEGSVNQFLYDSTRTGQWGFRPDWRDSAAQSKIRVDSDLKERFDRLSPKSQALVRAVFKHGDDMLAQKKAAVESAINAEYDAAIAQARADGDAARATKLEADKAAQIKHYKSLFAISEFKPYAPLKRFGDFVVVARSQEYLNADGKRQRQLETDENHYLVSFAESEAEARKMQRELQEDPAFAGGEAVSREKESVRGEMYGGMLSAFLKLKNTVDSKLSDATDPKEVAALGRTRSIVADLYLTALAESSARKSELRRRGVAGEIDMIRSFATQGRADAQFVSAVKFSDQTLKTFAQMRKEVRSADDQLEASKAFNELLKRHNSSLDWEPTPISDKIARVSSLWYLATSPAYYLQNMTQPFMLSIPFMSRKHNYLKAWGALLKGYADLAPMLRNLGIGEQFNYSAAPADVQSAISDLVDRGRIDIGMETDLGKFRVAGDSKLKRGLNKGDNWLHGLTQKVETINRLSTAIAAYRMERARTGSHEQALAYADEVITTTHGDYTRINAPRVFNTATGKVALQFRKYQLIQLTLLAKLVNNSFTGKDRAAAFKSLAFTLGHTAVMAGAVGLPGFAAISWALGALMGGDDEPPFDLEMYLREQVGEDWATLVTRGVPATLGVDLSSKLGMGNALSLLPYNDLDLTSRSGMESAIAAVVGGPAGGLGLRAADGLGLIADGQYYRGLEQLVPTGVAAGLRAGRFATEGVTRRNGDQLIDPDDISGMSAFWTSIGLQPTQMAERQKLANVQFKTEQEFKGRADKIRSEFLRGRKEGDADRVQEAREAWMTLQEARDKAGFKRQPLSALLKAAQAQAVRERNTVNGLQFNKNNRRFVEETAGVR